MLSIFFLFEFRFVAFSRRKQQIVRAQGERELGHLTSLPRVVNANRIGRITLTVFEPPFTNVNSNDTPRDTISAKAFRYCVRVALSVVEQRQGLSLVMPCQLRNAYFAINYIPLKRTQTMDSQHLIERIRSHDFTDDKYIFVSRDKIVACNISLEYCSKNCLV